VSRRSHSSEDLLAVCKLRYNDRRKGSLLAAAVVEPRSGGSVPLAGTEARTRCWWHSGLEAPGGQVCHKEQHLVRGRMGPAAVTPLAKVPGRQCEEEVPAAACMSLLNPLPERPGAEVAKGSAAQSAMARLP
jgi:hypothetical protein